MKQAGKIRIGTSNITFPGNKSSFPTEFQLRTRLHYYSTLFPTTEINSSFYKILLPATLEKWEKDVTDHFQFTLKLFKGITHAPLLQCDLNDIDRFMLSANRIVYKKGCILVQFPGKITLEYFNKVEEILKQVAQQNQQERPWRIAVEFRHDSWHIGEAEELVNQLNMGMVLHDFRKAKLPTSDNKADFVYIRMHGPMGDYRGDYNDALLQSKAVQIKKLAAQGKDVYVYFNNTAGNAFGNGKKLESMVKGAG